MKLNEDQLITSPEWFEVCMLPSSGTFAASNLTFCFSERVTVESLFKIGQDKFQSNICFQSNNTNSQPEDESGS